METNDTEDTAVIK